MFCNAIEVTVIDLRHDENLWSLEGLRNDKHDDIRVRKDHGKH